MVRRAVRDLRAFIVWGKKKKERLKKEKNIKNCNISVIDLKIIENLKSKRVMVYIFDIPLIVFIKSKLLNACCFSTF